MPSPEKTIRSEKKPQANENEEINSLSDEGEEEEFDYAYDSERDEIDT